MNFLVYLYESLFLANENTTDLKHGKSSFEKYIGCFLTLSDKTKLSCFLLIFEVG